MGRKIAAWLVFPVLVAAAVTAYLLLLGSGMAPPAATSTVVIPATLLVILLERILPYAPAWNMSRGDMWADGVHTLVSSVLLPELIMRYVVGGAGLGALLWLSSRLSEALGMGLWPGGWPLVGQLGYALLVTELGHYWVHRLMHERAFLWRFHAVHHSAPRVYWLNAGRMHPVDALGTLAVSLPVLALLGCPAETLGLYLTLGAVHGMLQHANIDMRLGPLNWVLSQAELHRWHHAPDAADSNHNYGAILILWDVVFATRYLPRDARPPLDTGIREMPHFPRGYLAQLAAPFRWRALLTRGAHAPDSGEACR